AFVTLKPIHLHQQLVKGLLSLIMTPAEASTTLTPNSINLIDENDTGGMLLRVFKHVPHQRGTYPYKHLDEIRARNSEKRYLSLTGNRLGQQGFTRSWRPHHEYTTRDFTS